MRFYAKKVSIYKHYSIIIYTTFDILSIIILLEAVSIVVQIP